MAPSELDFTSSLFLGVRHGSAALPRWESLTTGVPAVLHRTHASRRLGAAVATSHGAQAGLPGRSALHCLMDVMGLLPRRGDVVALDSAAYPISRWAALRAAASGAVVRTYPHHRPGHLAAPPGRRLFVVTDGWCAGCGRPAPLEEMRSLALDGRGALVVDDSLAFGVLGRRDRAEPFGDGSGTLRWSGVDHGGVTWVASLAKAYGAPLAVTTGDRAAVGRLAVHGGNQAHSSPPSAADLAAGNVALDNGWSNAARRARLSSHVHRLRGHLRESGRAAIGLPFPIVSVRHLLASEARRWAWHLRRRGIRALVQQPACGGGTLVSMLVRADHTDSDIDRLVVALGDLAARRVAS